MNCEWTRDNLVLYIYEELADDAKFEFERHVQHCLACRQELESARGFKEQMSALPVQEISPNFLTSNRMELQEALEHAQQARRAQRAALARERADDVVERAPAVRRRADIAVEPVHHERGAVVERGGVAGVREIDSPAPVAGE